jgi:imidazole glycerol-phosphate synthase subunit HisF
MLRARVIPCLLLKGSGLVKTVQFAAPKYVGDPINAVRIFNDKEVDELILLDIDASRRGGDLDYERIRDIVSEAFMPVTYGGGIRTVQQAQTLVSVGVEKIVVNTAALHDMNLVRGIADRLGSSSTVVAVDVKKDWLGRYTVYSAAAGKATGKEPIEHLKEAVDAGAGELFVNDVARDGTCKGYDLDLVRKVTSAVNVPVIASGGAGMLEHLREAVSAGASAVAAGSMFVYVGKHRAVMINYPPYQVLQELFANV